MITRVRSPSLPDMLCTPIIFPRITERVSQFSRQNVSANIKKKNCTSQLEFQKGEACTFLLYVLRLDRVYWLFHGDDLYEID